ncbi:MAG: SDR family NAD(P)-dependent oxidoreductase [Lawsonella sp.]|nr:SDR family NAD(P)-dependent oxidoreductase [Mycobacteriales bacterium]
MFKKLPIPAKGAVIGAGGGIGRATALKLAENGMDLVLGDRDVALAEKVRDEIGDKVSVIVTEIDVTDPESVRAFVDLCYDELGQVDIAFNSAGIMYVGGYLEEPDDVVVRQVEINLLGVIHVTRAFTKVMKERNYGHLITMASMGSILPDPGEATYAAAKHGVYGYLSSVREELRDTKVEISGIIPAVVDTRLATGTSGGGTRILPPEEVADAIIETIQRPVFIKSIPAWAVPLNRVVRAFPQKVYDLAMKLIVPDQSKVADLEARKKYEEDELR